MNRNGVRRNGVRRNGVRRNGVRSGLANPSHLNPIVDDDNDEVIKIVIETPKGSRNKYAFDPEERTFTLKKVLPCGMSFPYDFGFVPSTEADDGDPVDVLMLMAELRDFWLSLPQLNDPSGLNQMAKECDHLVKHLSTK